MEVSADCSTLPQEVQRITKDGVPVMRRDYMDLDEFLLVASNFDGSSKTTLKDTKADMNFPPQAFPGSIYNSLLNHINTAQNMRNAGYYSEKRQDERGSRPRDRADLYPSDDDSSNEESRDGSECSPGERVSQAVSVIVNDAKEQDACDSSGDSVDSGFGRKGSSTTDEDQMSRFLGGGKSKNRRRRKSEYIYNPLPVGRKSTRKFVPTDKKDDRYWEQRIKNNIAAKRSREARRQKEMEILNRCQALVDENDSLKEHNEQLQCKIEELEQRLQLYNKVVSNENVVLVKV